MANTPLHKILWLGCLLLLAIAIPAQASHLIGGKMSYKYLGATGAGERYEVLLTIYADCQNGQPDATMTDNPAYIAVYGNASHKLVAADTSVNYFSSTVLAPNSLNPCNTSGDNACVLAREFKREFVLPPSPDGYTVSYQRCCFPNSTANIVNPADNGATYYCVIPPTINKNTSAVFKYNAQVITCINDDFAMDLSAADADGDSVSYEMANVLKGASVSYIKPFPLAGPYDSVNYVLPATTLNPLGAAGGMYLHPATGILSGKPDRIGNYFLAVNCIEWRGGVAINRVYQQFQMVVVNCSSLFAATRKDTAVIKGATVQFHAGGGTKYRWYTNYNLSNDTIPNPKASFPEVGVFSYVVVTTAVIGCEATDTIVVHVVEHSDAAMPNAFSPNGDGLNDIFKPEFIGPCSVKYLRVYNRYGNMVYEGTGGWDGRYNGKQQDMQVFAWSLLYENNIGETKLLKGNVTLLR